MRGICYPRALAPYTGAFLCAVGINNTDTAVVLNPSESKTYCTYREVVKYNTYIEMYLLRTQQDPVPSP